MAHTWPSVGVFYMVLILYATACLGAFMLALVFVLLKFSRNEMLRHEDDVPAMPNDVDQYDEGEERQHRRHRQRREAARSDKRGARHCLLMLVQYVLGLCLVLIFVSCNIPLCACAILGGSLGIILNKWRRARRDD